MTSYTTTTTMAAQVLQLDELATPIATYLVAISPRSAVALAQTCRVLEVPALSALWGIQSSINLLISSVSPVDACRYSSGYGIVGRLLSSLGKLHAQPSQKT